MDKEDFDKFREGCPWYEDVLLSDGRGEYYEGYCRPLLSIELKGKMTNLCRESICPFLYWFSK